MASIGAVNSKAGTRAAMHSKLQVKPGEPAVLRLRLCAPNSDAFGDFAQIFNDRIKGRKCFLCKPAKRYNK